MKSEPYCYRVWFPTFSHLTSPKDSDVVNYGESGGVENDFSRMKSNIRRLKADSAIPRVC